MDNSVRDARSFLAAIKESSGTWLDPNQFNEEAVEFLETISERMFAQLDSLKITGRNRDRLIYYDAMLKGVILKLRKNVVQAEPGMKEN